MSDTTDRIGRRAFLGGAAMVAGAVPEFGSSQAPAGVSLREKFFGCVAGCHIGSAMGAPVETWPYSRTEKTYGTVDRLLPYGTNKWKRDPGTTEDGVERQKLMINAILDKQDRVTAEDVRKIWVRDIKPEGIGLISEPFEGKLLAMAKSGIPACDIGRYCDYAGLVSMARSCHPIGLINAGDIPGAVSDIFEVGQLYQTTNSRGLQWAAITGVAIAAATRPGATLDSVIAAILAGDARFRPDAEVVSEIQRGLKRTAGCQDFRELRKAFDPIYSGAGTPYAFSSASEIVTKSVCILRMTGGNLKDTIIASVNMGRDTDCAAAVAAGIAGALSGAASLPPEWIEQVDRATRLNAYTCSQRTLRETSDGLYNAFRARLQRIKTYLGQMEQLIAEG